MAAKWDKYSERNNYDCGGKRGDLLAMAGYGADERQARLVPGDVTLDFHGNLFIADTFNHRIRKVGVDGIMSTVAGNGATGYLGDGHRGNQYAPKLP